MCPALGGHNISHAEPPKATLRASRAWRADRSPDRPPDDRRRPRTSRSSRPPGLRWMHIERPQPADRAWLEEHFDFHPLDYEDVLSRNQRPKVDEYPEYLFVVLHFPRFDKSIGRLNAAELDMFVGPDFVITLPNEPIQPLEYLFERCKTREDQRDCCSPRARATCSTRSSTTASTRRFRCCARWATSSRCSRRTSSRAARARSCATSPTSSRRSSTSARSSARSARRCATSSARSATSPRAWTSTSTTSTTRPSASGTCSRTSRRSSRAWSRRTSRCSRTASTTCSRR